MAESPPPDASRFARARPWLAFAAALLLFLAGLAQWRDRAGDPGTIDDVPAVPADEATDGEADTDEGGDLGARAPARASDGVASAVDDGRALDAALASIYAAAGIDVPDGALEKTARPGCPPPPPDPPSGSGGGGTPWTPAVTVAEQDLPAPEPMIDWTSDASPATGKGMWVWKYSQTEGEDFRAVVDRAVAAGLEQLWIRVGDSRNGFYAGQRMQTLVPLAHEAGLRVIGWGFPFLHDPLGDVAWSAEAMAWRGPDGRGLDGFSPDIERETEGVKLSARRVEVYLAALRAAAGDLPVLATVYPPEDWVLESGYPYEQIAPWVDAFVPMAYWGCGDSGLMATNAVTRLAHLGRPVHVIGQAYGNTSSGRRVPPNQQETWRFLDVAAREGAIGASFWVWQSMGDEQWDALTRFPWREAAATAAASRDPAA